MTANATSVNSNKR